MSIMLYSVLLSSRLLSSTGPYSGIPWKGGTAALFKDGREISRMQMNGICQFFQGDGMIEVRGNIVHGFF